MASAYLSSRADKLGILGAAGMLNGELATRDVAGAWAGAWAIACAAQDSGAKRINSSEKGWVVYGSGGVGGGGGGWEWRDH